MSEEKLNLDKFNPQKSEIQKAVNEAKELKIKNIKDANGYALVDETRKKLKKMRVEITKTGKSLRADAISFQRAVLVKEKELVALIVPTENLLENRQKDIDDEKTKISRLKILPERQVLLKEIKLEIADDHILIMDNNEFNTFYLDKKAIFIDEENRIAKEKQEEAQKKIDKDNAKIAETKRINKATIKARKEVIELANREARIAKEKAELEKQKEIQKVKDDAENEKQELINKQKAKEEKEKADKEKQEHKDREENARKIKEQKEFEEQEKFKKFLINNGYTNKTKDNFYIKQDETKVILYKKIGEFNK